MDNVFARTLWTRLENGFGTRSPLNAYVQEICRSAESSKDSCFLRFKSLTRVLIPGHISILGMKADVYESALNDIALEKIWSKIQKQIKFKGASIPSSASAIRAWINNPANAGKIDQIKRLDLSDMDLKVLPSEIGAFTELLLLNLEDNQLQVLPQEIGALTELEWLHLSGNELQVLPSEIGDLANLLMLDLSSNKFQIYPSEIGALAKLTQLYLSRNKLRVLPPEIGALTRLQVLWLSNNQLQVLPSEIGYLARLQELELSNNQLHVLPPEIGDLASLQSFKLRDNPLMVVLDKDLKSGSCKNYIEKYQANVNFPCATPFASLCQVLHLGKEDSALLEHFGKLSDGMKKQIIEKLQSDSTSAFFSSSTSCNQIQDLLSDRALFAKAVVQAANEKMNGLDPAKRSEIYRLVWELAGRPVGDSNWGENHASDNIIRLIEAMELATSD